MSRLLVLGAGLFQLSGITRAVELGLEVITVDNVPSSPGHRLAHRSVNLSTTNADLVANLAAELSVDAVVTFSSDVAVESVAAATTVLGRPGPARAVVRMLSDKARFRTFQQTNGLPCPWFETIPPDASIGRADLRTVLERGPLLVKPTDSSGSKGVTLVAEPEPMSVKDAIEAARADSRRNSVIVEGFLPGTEVGGDAFLVDGHVRHVIITEKYLDGVVVRGHRYPNRSLTDAQISAVVSSVEDCCAAAALTQGPVNFDVMINGTSAVVIEMSPRTGGNGIPRVGQLVDGVDFERATILLALGQDPQVEKDPAKTLFASARSIVLTAPGPGTVVRVEDPRNVAASDSRIAEVWLSKTDGERVGRASEPYGYLVFGLRYGGAEPDWDDLTQRSWMQLERRPV